MINYGTNTGITLDLSSLAPSADFTAVKESSQIDNTTDRYDDVLVEVNPITGHASTPPVLDTEIRLYLWGALVSLATTPIDTLDGTHSNETLTHVSILNSLRLVGSAEVTVNAAALQYIFQPFSVASFFGGIMPKFWGIVAGHNQAGALGGSNNNLFRYSGVKYTAN